MNDLKIAIVDLDRRTVEITSREEDLRRESVGGAALNLNLIEQHGKENLIFGAGPLTGTFAPASALLVGSFASSRAGVIVHVPLLLTAGPDFRCSGIDHLVLLGAAERPILLHIDGGRVRFVELPPQASDLPSLEVSLQRSAPPFRSAILTGPAADAGVSLAAVSLGAKGSLDKAGLAGAMTAKNLKGILLGGSGGIGFADGDLRCSLDLAGRIRRERKRGGGFASLVESAGGGDCLKALKGAKFSDAACFHCPAPCMVHARFTAADPRLPQGPKKQNGLLLMDPVGWIALAGKRGERALPLLWEAVRLGLDPAAAASLLPGEGVLTSDFDALSAMARGERAESPSTAQAPASSDPTFGGGLVAVGTGEEARRRTALAFILGVCPRLLQRFPQIVVDLPAFLPVDFLPASLDRAVERVLAQG